MHERNDDSEGSRSAAPARFECDTRLPDFLLWRADRRNPVGGAGRTRWRRHDDREPDLHAGHGWNAGPRQVHRLDLSACLCRLPHRHDLEKRKDAWFANTQSEGHRHCEPRRGRRSAAQDDRPLPCDDDRCGAGNSHFSLSTHRCWRHRRRDVHERLLPMDRLCGCVRCNMGAGTNRPGRQETRPCLRPAGRDGRGEGG